MCIRDRLAAFAEIVSNSTGLEITFDLMNPSVFFGALVGSISQTIIAICLAFAAGAMIYIVSGELTPESNKLYNGRMTAVGNICGLLLGILVLNIT